MNRPKLSHETLPEFLDWTLHNWSNMQPDRAQAHLTAAELLIRTKANEAQAKDTQHTLVRDGVIDPPPAAS